MLSNHDSPARGIPNGCSCVRVCVCVVVVVVVCVGRWAGGWVGGCVGGGVGWGVGGGGRMPIRYIYNIIVGMHR